MPFTHAFLELVGNGKLRKEESLVADCLKERGIPVSFYTVKRIRRRQLPLQADTFVMGDLDAMHGAMKQLGIEIPPVDTYPKSLKPFLRREIRRTTLGELEQRLHGRYSANVFAKPAQRSKRFTGRVFSSPSDLYFVGNTSRKEPIWCSEVVDWTSEFRVYVIDGAPVSIDCYAGNPNAELDLGVVHEALAEFQKNGAPVAYGIDFGILDRDETALIEYNDGFSLGAYQIPKEPYTDLLWRRWEELVFSITSTPKRQAEDRPPSSSS